jgi:signal transduction histidine kinase
VLILTGSGNEAAAVRAMKAGALDYLVKSEATLRDMPHIVARALREWHAMQARARGDRLLRAQCDIASILATSMTLADAGPRILATICAHAGWVLGELWGADPQDGTLRREAFWSADGTLGASARVYPDLASMRGVGELVWASDDSRPLPDVLSIPGVDRRLVAPAELRCAFGHVLATAGRLVGAITFFSRDGDATHDDLVQLLETSSSPLAIFIARQQAEEDRSRLHEALLEQERLAAIGQTAACLAHEISNPLSGMYLAGQLMQRRVETLGEADPKLSDVVRRLLSENRRLNALLDEFRLLSQRQTIERVPTDLHALVDYALGLLQPLFEDAGVHAEMDIAASMPILALDGAKLTQVVLNLAKNAAEAMAPRGGRLVVRARLAGADLRLDVADTGPGLPDGVDVFEPFRTTKAKGTGLGLAIARQILTAHGGSIDCASVRGAGTTFRIVLPVPS